MPQLIKDLDNIRRDVLSISFLDSAIRKIIVDNQSRPKITET